MATMIESVGYLCILYALLHVVYILCEIVIPLALSRICKNKTLDSLTNKWAVITGATDGIGKAYANELCIRGLKVVLIGRNEKKLKQTESEIHEKVSTAVVMLVQFDFESQNFDSLLQQLLQLDIGILVNNVGLTYAIPDHFHKFPGGLKKAESLIQVNCATAMKLTYAVLPQMLRCNEGIIVNISSGYGLYPVPLLAVYSASKAFLINFTRSLQREYSGTNLFIQNLMPLYVVTRMSPIRESFFAPSATNYAKSAVASIGWKDNTVGYIPHGLQWLLIKINPEFVLVQKAKALMEAIRSIKLKPSRSPKYFDVFYTLVPPQNYDY